MSRLSDRVYNILMDNAKKPIQKRGVVDILGGSRISSHEWEEPSIFGYDVEHTISDPTIKTRRSRPKNKALDIAEYDMEEEAEPIDYMTEQSGGCYGCPYCNGSGLLYGKKPPVGAITRRGGKKVTRTRTKVTERPNKTTTRTRTTTKGGEALQYYNKCLKHFKEKGYSHNEAKHILNQMKEEFKDEYFAGGKNGEGWKKFFNVLKGIGKTALQVAPMLL